MKKNRFWQLVMVGLIFLTIPAQVQSCGETKNSGGSPKEQLSSGGPVKEGKEEKTGGGKATSPETATGQMTLTLYFADEQAMYLLPEVREVPKTEAVARAALEELVKGPQVTGHVKTIPAGTRLLGIRVENGLAYVDFSREFVDNHPGGSAGETMTVYSVVNTLTEFSSIQKVKFLVEGKEIETLAEHMDLTQPVGRKEDIIKK